ncbi:hypothetical protein BJQ94_01965 [Cryobacterium sp. SO2]|uniref:hypothetical protein n=1 Tax=Cryobacterium sp. SO2 TaxID=1897060 RepID=UPI00223E5878|nr:hypothetical protein [Cryobacterium sp. SO2]WEO77836.1 hypothetical protein BJQ94_01965 [Cryobacterium sp. SO2]
MRFFERHRLSALATAAVLVVTLGGAALVNGAVRAEPAIVVPVAAIATDEIDLAAFQPGRIVSDFTFFNADAMTEAEIQTFLQSRSCTRSDSSPCLWEYRESTVSQPDAGAGHCAAYTGAEHERASRIISKVATACGISPRVLLVLLQKEQSLLSRPSESGYLRATGYGCPDTADCDADYFGFFNQVYNAAWQFRQYTQEPDRTYQIGDVEVGYNPDAACGTSVVDIQNQATANLYNYTPYQPNEAALVESGTDGDGCSTHGNLNFWLFYTAWFGSADTDPYPDVFDACLNYANGQPCRAPELIPSL